VVKFLIKETQASCFDRCERKHPIDRGHFYLGQGIGSVLVDKTSFFVLSESSLFLLFLVFFLFFLQLFFSLWWLGRLNESEVMGVQPEAIVLVIGLSHVVYSPNMGLGHFSELEHFCKIFADDVADLVLFG
jgi:hypothetical protein